MAADGGPRREPDRRRGVDATANEEPTMSEGNGTVFSCQDVRISIGERDVVKGVDLAVEAGEIHAIMGPNGSGKSTLANGLMGHPSYTTSGRRLLDGEDVSSLS